MSQAFALLPWLAAGVALGACYLYLIGRSVAAIGADAGWPAIVLPAALRLALAAAALVFAARHGALPLGAMLCGFLLARTAAIRRARDG